jgi:hypothetical protein
MPLGKGEHSRILLARKKQLLAASEDDVVACRTHLR